jgi:hypothetical protein
MNHSMSAVAAAIESATAIAVGMRTGIVPVVMAASVHRFEAAACRENRAVVGPRPTGAGLATAFERRQGQNPYDQRRDANDQNSLSLVIHANSFAAERVPGIGSARSGHPNEARFREFST